MFSITLTAVTCGQLSELDLAVCGALRREHKDSLQLRNTEGRLSLLMPVQE